MDSGWVEKSSALKSEDTRGVNKPLYYCKGCPVICQADKGGKQMYSSTVQDPAVRNGWTVSTPPQSLYPQERDTEPVVQETGWASEPVLKCTENFAPTSIRSMGRSVRSESLCRPHSPRPCCSGNINLNTLDRGTLWRSWLRHCATIWKVAGQIPDGVIGIFHLLNHSGHTTALESTQSLTEMSTRDISWGVKAVGAQGCNLTTCMCRLSRNLGASNSWNHQGLKYACTWIALPCTLDDVKSTLI